MTAYADQDALRAALARMFDLMQHDAAFRAGTQKARLSVGFEISDLDLTFVLSFERGNINAQLDALPDAADVQLSLTSDTYDRMFGGELAPLQAALAGDLAFAGNIAAAMGLQSLLPEMIRVYKNARES